MCGRSRITLKKEHNDSAKQTQALLPSFDFAAMVDRRKAGSTSVLQQ